MTGQKINHVIHHTTDFLLLSILLTFGLAGLYYFQYQPEKQIIIALFLSLLYFFWGVLHHYHEGNLTWEVALEYIAMAALVGFVLVVFLLRI